MTLTFASRIDGNRIRCAISTDRPLAAPVFCFSLMAAPKVISGGTMVRWVAGYAEVALPDLGPGTEHEVVLEHAHKEFGPRNRAWLPLGAYLRVGKECLPLPPGNDIGLREGEGPPAPVLAADRLPLVPQPTEWKAASGTVAFSAVAPVAGLERVQELAARLGLAAIVAPEGTALSVTEDPDLGPPLDARRAGDVLQRRLVDPRGAGGVRRHTPGAAYRRDAACVRGDTRRRHHRSSPRRHRSG